MKKNENWKSALVLSALTLASSMASAGQILNCSVGGGIGSSRIEILSVDGRPELKVFQIDLVLPVTHNAQQPGNKLAHVEGFLTAQVDDKDNLLASGMVFNAENAEIIINPETITLQGSLKESSDGKIHITLYDSDRVLQLGFGIGLSCR